MEEENLKVSDLVDLSKGTYTETHDIIKKLTALSAEYHSMTDFYDPYELERIKRQFDSYMQSFAVYYARIKKFKGNQHVYLDEVRKKIKAEALQQLIDEGVKVTAADSLVYKSKYYVKRVNLMEDIKEFMIKTELLYDRFNTTFHSIVQSYSAAKKEFENSKQTNG
jgi:hypothetical protein